MRPWFGKSVVLLEVSEKALAAGKICFEVLKVLG